MTEQLPALGTAFLTGLLGSVHCFGMCAGIAGLVAVRADGPQHARRVPVAIAYNGGRLLSYALTGLLVAGAGAGAVALLPVLAAPLRLVAGCLIVMVGLQTAFGWRLLAPLERRGAGLWSRIAPRVRGLLPITTLPRAVALGMAWGWLPCGLVYSVLLVAASTHRPEAGALVMLAFGLGTLPSMLTTGLGAAGFSGLLQHRGTRLGSGLLIVVLGLVTLAMPVLGLLAPSAHHHA